jgi:hypothetical protein
MESLVIRPFTPSDQDRVTEIFIDWNRHLATPETADAFEAYIRRSIDDEIGRIPDYYQAHPKSGFWVAETDAKTGGGVVAGMVGIERLSDDEAEVRRMYVDSGWRRPGHRQPAPGARGELLRRGGIRAYRPQYVCASGGRQGTLRSQGLPSGAPSGGGTSRPTAPSAVASGAITT